MPKHTKRHKVKTHHVEGFHLREVRPGYWLADQMVQGVRVRKAFSDFALAETFCRVKAREIVHSGTQALSLPEAARRDALAALRLLEGTGKGLEEAAAYYVSRHPMNAGETLRQTCDRYLAMMEKEGRREASVNDKRWKLAALCDALGDQPTSAVEGADLDAWTSSRGWAEGTARAYRGAADTVLAFYTGNGKRRHRSSDAKPPATWDAETVARLLAAAEASTPDVVPALAIQFFAGLRPTEMLRLTWADVDLGARLVRLRGEQTKTRDMRNVAISDNLAEWLTRYRGEGCIVASAVRYRTLREKAMQAAGLTTWPVDVARHTFATAYYHLHDDAARTAAQLGHFGSAATFVRFYKGCPVTADDAQRYFSIMPTKGGAQ